MQAVKEQFPEEDGYVLNFSSCFNFPDCIEFLAKESEDFTLVMDPHLPKVRMKVAI